MNSNYNNFSDNSILSGEIYYIKEADTANGAYPRSKGVWANRLGVVISSQDDIDTSDCVFVVFLSKAALTSSWYDGFSPAQAVVQVRGEARSALCSHVVCVGKDELDTGAYRGKVTEEELLSLVKAVKKSFSPEDVPFACLYSPDSGPQAA